MSYISEVYKNFICIQQIEDMSSNDFNIQMDDSCDVEKNREAKESKTMPQVGSIVCRICYNSDHVDRQAHSIDLIWFNFNNTVDYDLLILYFSLLRLISPCSCKGSLGFVHLQCLEHWLSCSGLLHCELCMFQYNTKSTLK